MKVSKILFLIVFCFFSFVYANAQSFQSVTVTHSGRMSPDGVLEDVVGTEIGFTIYVVGTEETEHSVNLIWENTDSPVLHEEIVGSGEVSFPSGDSDLTTNEQTIASFSVSGFSVRYTDIYEFDVRSGGVSWGGFSINVSDAGEAPSVTITYPSDGAIFAPGQKVQISADVYDSDGGVSRVEFLLGNNTNSSTGDEFFYILEEVSEEPFTSEWEVPGYGAYQLSVIAYDNKGNRSRSEIVTVYGSDSPVLEELTSITLLTPLDGAFLSPLNPIELSVNVQPEALRDHVTVDYFVNGFRINDSAITDSSGGFFVYSWDSSYIGTHRISARAQLNNGTFVETNEDVDVTVVGYGSAPEVSLSVPSTTGKVVGNEVQFTAQASDSGALIDSIEFYWNGELFQTLSSANTQGPFTFPTTGQLRLVSSGKNSFWVIAAFSNGNRGRSNVVEIDVGLGSNPVVSLISPFDDMTFIPGTSLPLLATAHDPDSLINSLNYYVNETLVGTATRNSNGTFTSELGDTSSITYSFPFAGDYNIYVQAMDESGIVTQSMPVTVTVGQEDLNAPRVFMNHPLPLGGGDTINDPSVGSTMFINAKATDADGVIRLVKFYMNGQYIGSSTNQFEDTYSMFYTVTTPGSYIIFAEALDNSGKKAHSTPLIFNADSPETKHPTIEMLALSEDDEVVDAGTEITMSAQADGGLAGISQVNFYVNGVFIEAIDTPLEDTDIYSTTIELTNPGTYFLNARAVQIEPLGLPTDNWVVSDAIAVLVEAASGNRGFIQKIYSDFYGTEPPQSILDSGVIALDSGQKTQSQYVYEQIQAETFDSTREALMTRYLLTGSWPNREVMRQDAASVSASGLAQFVTLLLPTFQTKYWGGNRIPDAFSSDKDFEDFAKILFERKFGQAGDDDQIERSVSRMKFLGTQAFLEQFIQDIEALPFGSGTISSILGIPNPPNTRLSDSAETAVLMINLWRITPSASDVDGLSGQSLISRIDTVLADPRFTHR